MQNDNKKPVIAIIGLGYVGLPLAIEFGNIYKTKGFDIDHKRINELEGNIDRTNEVPSKILSEQRDLQYTSDINDIKNCNVYIITVPTPIDSNNNPDFKHLSDASEMIGDLLKIGDYVIYESTVYPGATEEICVPILEELSGFKMNDQFFVGYSPERINPGDKSKGVSDIVKVTSGSNNEAAFYIDELYSSIITAGTHKAPSIMVAEAAKVIENTQRDLNIALMNELSMLFNEMNIDTNDVLKAAGTKWNFLPFEPGLVGGHCIGVDPYYLTYKAESIGFSPEIILAGRVTNDAMAKIITDHLVEKMIEKQISIAESNILVMGFTFKENCPDHRNTKVVDIFNELKKTKANIEVYDPWPNKKAVESEYDIKLIDYPKTKQYDAVIITVKHQEFIDIGIENINQFRKPISILADLKSLFDKNQSNYRL